jgi:hypothetical protein
MTWISDWDCVGGGSGESTGESDSSREATGAVGEHGPTACLSL